MEAFFSRFPGFDYDPKSQEELEFNRLRVVQGWEPFSLTYKNIYKEFLKSLVEETGAAVDKFFIIGYPSFDYKRRSSPISEFWRLQLSQGWEVSSDEYKRARNLFEDAYDEQFNRDVDGFFNGFPKFDYNPRNEAKAEFERLRKFNGWYEKRGEKFWEEEVKERKKIYWEARQSFFSAFINDFTYFFGHGDSMRDWEYLCDVLQVNPTPSTIEDCKVELKPFCVNIYNLLDHVQTKVPIIYHDDLEKLAHYSVKQNRLFPLELAKTTCMRFLLRKITISNGRLNYHYDDWSSEFKYYKPRSTIERLYL